MRAGPGGAGSAGCGRRCPGREEAARAGMCGGGRSGWDRGDRWKEAAAGTRAVQTRCWRRAERTRKVPVRTAGRSRGGARRGASGCRAPAGPGWGAAWGAGRRGKAARRGAARRGGAVIGRARGAGSRSVSPPASSGSSSPSRKTWRTAELARHGCSR